MNLASSDKLPILAIMLALLIWGGLLALGAYLFRDSFDLRKPLIVMGSVGGFVACWVLLLLVRGRRRNGSHHDQQA